jgi:hypothetical protein
METRPTQFITFDGDRLWKAIDFHLDQSIQPIWNFCDEITADSLTALQSELLDGSLKVRITRAKWRSFDDVHRLDWLLEKAGTVLKLMKDTNVAEFVPFEELKAELEADQEADHDDETGTQD